MFDLTKNELLDLRKILKLSNSRKGKLRMLYLLLLIKTMLSLFLYFNI